MLTFKSLTKVQEATILEIQAAGIPLEVAKRIKETLSKSDPKI